MFRATLYGTFTCIALLSLQLTAAQNTANDDSKFVNTAYQAGQAEIALADLATSRSQNVDVKVLATKIKSDHQKANAELKTLAGKRHITLSTTMAPDYMSTKSRLEKLTGSDFDRAYADMMVTDHQKAIADFTKASMSSDPDVKLFATTTLSALREHLQRSEEIQRKST